MHILDDDELHHGGQPGDPVPVRRGRAGASLAGVGDDSHGALRCGRLALRWPPGGRAARAHARHGTERVLRLRHLPHLRGDVAAGPQLRLRERRCPGRAGPAWHLQLDRRHDPLRAPEEGHHRGHRRLPGAYRLPGDGLGRRLAGHPHHARRLQLVEPRPLPRDRRLLLHLGPARRLSAAWSAARWHLEHGLRRLDLRPESSPDGHRGLPEVRLGPRGGLLCLGSGRRQVGWHGCRQRRAALRGALRPRRRAVRAHEHGGSAFERRPGAEEYLDFCERWAVDRHRGAARHQPGHHRQREQRGHHGGRQDRALGLRRLPPLLRLGLLLAAAERHTPRGHRRASRPDRCLHDVSMPGHRLGRPAGGDPILPDCDGCPVHLLHPQRHHRRNFDGSVPHGFDQGPEGRGPRLAGAFGLPGQTGHDAGRGPCAVLQPARHHGRPRAPGQGPGGGCEAVAHELQASHGEQRPESPSLRGRRRRCRGGRQEARRGSGQSVGGLPGVPRHSQLHPLI
mmetsp:Transcript_56435/g.165693  ORF Transcript_56435/g.165693 Transcript_56435/m.165693 type:complete len:509 (+) Transcript_56435:358-1884(+)